MFLWWILDVNVVSVLFWGILLLVLLMILGSVFFNNLVFKKFNLLCIVLILFFFLIWIDCCEMILFVLSFLIIYIIVILVFFLLLIIVWCIGVFFLYLGSNDVWILIVFNLGVLSKDFGNSWLNVVVIIKFDFKESNDFNFWEFLSFLGWYIGIWCFVVIFFIGGGVIIFLCFIGLLGCVIIVIILCLVINIFKIFVEKLGVFIKMILFIVKICFYFSFI